MFRHRSLLRRWAARVLVLWSFGIGLGVANACVTSGVAAADPLGAQHAGAALHSGHAMGHHGSLVTANCQDFCAKVTVSVPLLKTALDDVQAPAVVQARVAPIAPAAADASVPLRRPVPALSVAIAYLRLAL